jgi:hypothetical protein
LYVARADSFPERPALRARASTPLSALAVRVPTRGPLTPLRFPRASHVQRLGLLLKHLDATFAAYI